MEASVVLGMVPGGFLPPSAYCVLSTHASYLQASLHPGRVLMLFPLEDTGQESPRHASLKAKQTGRTSVFLFLGLFPHLAKYVPQLEEGSVADLEHLNILISFSYLIR